MSATHTPGTWCLLRQGQEIIGGDPPMHEVCAEIEGRSPLTIAYFPLAAGSEEHGEPDSRIELSAEESLANGALFAAAPLLLAELRRLAAAYEWPPSHPACVALAAASPPT